MRRATTSSAIFFLLAAVAVALNAAVRAASERGPRAAAGRGAAGRRPRGGPGRRDQAQLPPARRGARRRARAGRAARRAAGGRSALGGLAALAGGGYWYLRNLAHTGNPLPWFTDLGPISLPGPDQALGGREGHSVLGYLTDGSVWSEWFLPGLHHGLCVLLAAARSPSPSPASSLCPRPRAPARYLRVAGAVGLAAALAWLVAPTSASGPDGMPRGFESGLRYLAPALILGMALLPRGAVRESPRRKACGHPSEQADTQSADRTRSALVRARDGRCSAGVVVLLAVAVGYPVQRHYLENRYKDPTFTTPGLNAVFAWAARSSPARGSRPPAPASTRSSAPISPTGSSSSAVTSPTAASSRRRAAAQWRRLLDEGEYDYVVASRDRIEPGRPPYPPGRGPKPAGPKPSSKAARTVVFDLDPSSRTKRLPRLSSGWPARVRSRRRAPEVGATRRARTPPSSPYSARRWTRSAISRSSPTSTTASRRSPTGSSRSPAPSTRRKCRRRCSTRWTSSASAGSRSRRRRCGSSTRPPTGRPTTCT